jgi:hypothetical protein
MSRPAVQFRGAVCEEGRSASAQGWADTDPPNTLAQASAGDCLSMLVRLLLGIEHAREGDPVARVETRVVARGQNAYREPRGPQLRGDPHEPRLIPSKTDLPRSSELMLLRRVMWPSTGPVLQGILSHACTTVSSSRGGEDREPRYRLVDDGLEPRTQVLALRAHPHELEYVSESSTLAPYLDRLSPTSAPRASLPASTTCRQV